MTTHCSSQFFGWSRRAMCLTALAATIAIPSAVWAFGGIRQSVGGIHIDTGGAVSNAERDQLGRLREMRIKGFLPVPGELNQPARPAQDFAPFAQRSNRRMPANGKASAR